jgi:YidC/Oxa1 family membrane protein insertase
MKETFLNYFWNPILFQPLLNLLLWLDKLTGNLGWSIVIMTVALRLAMTPLVLPSLRASKKLQDLAPEMAKLKVKFKGDKTGLMTAQSALYKERGLNPAAGCLPQILQIVVLIALFNTFNLVLRNEGNDLVQTLNKSLYSYNQLPANYDFSTRFFYLDLTKPDVFKVPGLPIPLPGLFLLLSAIVQLLSSKMMMPIVKKEEKIAKATEEPTDDIMTQTQSQMLYLFPLMTIVFGFQFPSGLVIYWFVFSAVSMVQQYYASGWGGLAPWMKRLGMLK